MINLGKHTHVPDNLVSNLKQQNINFLNAFNYSKTKNIELNNYNQTLETKIAELKSKIYELENKETDTYVQSLEHKIYELESSKENDTSHINSLQCKIYELESSKENDTTHINSLQSKINELNNHIKILENTKKGPSKFVFMD